MPHINAILKTTGSHELNISVASELKKEDPTLEELEEIIKNNLKDTQDEKGRT